MGIYQPVVDISPLTFDIALICLSGHVVNESTKRFPGYNTKYCKECGEKTINSCPNCKHTIRGARAGMVGFVSAPAYCEECGHPFPWTETKIQTALHLFAEEMADKDAIRQFEESVRTISKGNPEAPLAANRLGKLVARVTTTITADAIKKTVVEVASETIKKTLLSVFQGGT